MINWPQAADAVICVPFYNNSLKGTFMSLYLSYSGYQNSFVQWHISPFYLIKTSLRRDCKNLARGIL